MRRKGAPSFDASHRPGMTTPGSKDLRMTADHDAELIEDGRKLFAGDWKFVWASPSIETLPPMAGMEVAFAGRSNVGKSSLINALTGRRTLARTSNTPGRTQQLNFFDLGGRLRLVDMPGYGYAKESKDKVEAWNSLVRRFLKGRVVLRRALVLIDARHGLKPNDQEILTMLDQAAVPYQIILTKADKVKPQALDNIRAQTAAALKKHPAAFPEVHVTSSDKGVGIAELRASLAKLTDA